MGLGIGKAVFGGLRMQGMMISSKEHEKEGT
jgi:hypothetical protein